MKFKQSFWRIWPVVLWAVLMVYFFTSVPSGMPKFSALASIPHFDKIFHFSVFSIWALLLAFAFFATKQKTFFFNQNKKAFYFLTIAVAYAIFLETLQLFLPYRSFEWADLAANLLGVLAGSMLYRWLPLSRIGGAKT